MTAIENIFNNFHPELIGSIIEKIEPNAEAKDAFRSLVCDQCDSDDIAAVEMRAGLKHVIIYDGCIKYVGDFTKDEEAFFIRDTEGRVLMECVDCGSRWFQRLNEK